MTGQELPLDGLRVLDYGQYVASPFATMLLVRPWRRRDQG